MSLEYILINHSDLVRQFFFPILGEKDLLCLTQVSTTAKKALETTEVSQPDLTLNGRELTISLKGIGFSFRRHRVKMNALEDLYELPSLVSCMREEVRKCGLDTSNIDNYIEYAATHPYPGRIALSLIPFDYYSGRIPLTGNCSLESALDHMERETKELRSYAQYYRPRYLKLILCHPNAANLPNKIELQKLSNMSTSTHEKGD
jgi:hypothetical protein